MSNPDLCTTSLLVALDICCSVYVWNVMRVCDDEDGLSPLTRERGPQHASWLNTRQAGAPSSATDHLLPTVAFLRRLGIPVRPAYATVLESQFQSRVRLKSDHFSITNRHPMTTCATRGLPKIEELCHECL